MLLGVRKGNHLTLDVQVIPSTRWVLPSPSSFYGPLLSVFYDSAQADPGVILHGCLIFSVCIFLCSFLQGTIAVQYVLHIFPCSSQVAHTFCVDKHNALILPHFPVVSCPANLLSVACPWVQGKVTWETRAPNCCPANVGPVYIMCK